MRIIKLKYLSKIVIGKLKLILVPPPLLFNQALQLNHLNQFPLIIFLHPNKAEQSRNRPAQFEVA